MDSILGFNVEFDPFGGWFFLPISVYGCDGLLLGNPFFVAVWLNGSLP